MKTHFFARLFFLTASSLFAMEDIATVTVKIRQQLANVDELAERHSQILALSSQRCVGLEQELKELRSRQGSPTFSYFDASKVKTATYKKKADRGHREENIPVHLFLDHSPFEVKVEDLIKSNEEYFQRLVYLGRKNTRLEQEIERLGNTSTTTPVLSYSTSNLSSYSLPIDTGQPQVREGRYSPGWGGVDKVVHLYLGRQLYGRKAEANDIIESNENYFRQFRDLEDKNNFLSQENRRLEGEVSTLRTLSGANEVLERELLALRNNVDLLNALVSKKNQEVNALQDILRKSTEEAKEYTQRNYKEIEIREEQINNLRLRLVETENDLKGKSNAVSTLTREKKLLEDKIKMGMTVVNQLEQQENQLKRQLERKDEECEQSKEEMRVSHARELKKKDSELERLLSEGRVMYDKVRGECSAAEDNLHNYKRAIRRILEGKEMSPGLFEELNKLVNL